MQMPRQRCCHARQWGNNGLRVVVMVPKQVAGFTIGQMIKKMIYMILFGNHRNETFLSVCYIIDFALSDREGKIGQKPEER